MRFYPGRASGETVYDPSERAWFWLCRVCDAHAGGFATDDDADRAYEQHYAKAHVEDRP